MGAHNVGGVDSSKVDGHELGGDVFEVEALR